VILALFLTCVVALVGATLLLLLLGARLHFSSRILGIALSVALAVGAGEVAARLWNLPPRPVLLAEGAIVLLGIVVVLARPVWNPVGQVFYASFLAAALSYLGFAAWYTLAGGLSAIGAVASGLLLVLEIGALTLAAWYTFDGCDVVCRADGADPNRVSTPPTRRRSRSRSRPTTSRRTCWSRRSGRSRQSTTRRSRSS
jgi:hypothetical protein